MENHNLHKAQLSTALPVTFNPAPPLELDSHVFAVVVPASLVLALAANAPSPHALPVEGWSGSLFLS